MNGVYLVGAGPGDKDLITVRGASLLAAADVVVYDHLANPSLLNKVKKNCECIYVGKQSGNHTMKQEDINELLVHLAGQYKCVVRLKGGDPYVFGRGSEEGEVLKTNNIPFEVVPGITSAIGGLAYGGIPITARNVATSFHVITGHISKNSEDISFEHLAKLNGTLVFLMGVANLEHIVGRLIANGKASDTPMAIIHKASTPDQKVYEGTLDTIVKIAREENIKPPSLIVIGKVVSYRDTLKFYENKPLFGKHIVVTRSRKAQSKMADKLEKLGAKVTQIPAIRIEELDTEPLQHAIDGIDDYEGIIFTSGVAVNMFFKQLKLMGLDSRSLYKQKIMVVGQETGKVLSKFGIRPDYIPKVYSKEGLTELIKENIFNGKWLIPRSAKGDSEWLDEVREYVNITEIMCYDTVFENVSEHMKALRNVDYFTFTSSSTVHGFMHQLEETGQNASILDQGKIVSIGPITTETIKEYKRQVDLQPDMYTINSLVEEIVKDCMDKKES